jgi:hypothetical protein
LLPSNLKNVPALQKGARDATGRSAEFCPVIALHDVTAVTHVGATCTDRFRAPAEIPVSPRLFLCASGGDFCDDFLLPGPVIFSVICVTTPCDLRRHFVRSNPAYWDYDSSFSTFEFCRFWVAQRFSVAIAIRFKRGFSR